MVDRSEEKMMAEERAAGLENLRAMFRVTMAASALPGESLADTRARIAADPATGEVARHLECTIDELLHGFGGPQELLVDEDYDHDAATEEVAGVVAAVLGGDARAPHSWSRVERSAGPGAVEDGIVTEVLRHAGVRAAPHAEAPKRQVFGAVGDAALVRMQRMRALDPPRIAVGARAGRK